jgi:ribonuclease P protein component
LHILKNNFSKEEKLCSEKDIDLVYKTGHSFLSHPLVIYHLPQTDILLSKVLVSVSKRKFKKAVHRNLLKRRIREAYRLNKSILKIPSFLAFVYIGNEPATYQVIEKALAGGLQKING